MCRIVEEIVEKERAEVRIGFALKAIALGKLSYEEISAITGISLDEVKELAEKTSA